MQSRHKGTIMKKILILAFGNTVSLTFTGPLDVFHQAGSLYNRLLGVEESPLFDVKLVTVDGKPFETRTGMRVTPHFSLADAPKADLVMISSLASLNHERYPGAVEWLKGQAENGATLASVCTGAFLLAETGLLDGKTATTHWAFAKLFRERFPAVKLRPERILTDEGRILSSAGFAAAIDLSLYLVEKYGGHLIAMEIAKSMVYDLNRASQTPYSVFKRSKQHEDEAVLRVQNWLENNYGEELNYNDTANRFGLSLRSLERRFKAATGLTPLQYLHRVRIEAAKRLLEDSTLSFEEITFQVGYGDGGFFRKLFLQQTGLRPAEYRRRFKACA